MHRAAATLDGEATVTAAPLRESARLLDLGGEERPDLVAIAAGVDAAALKALTVAGYHLLIETPVMDAEQAEDLARCAKQSGSIITVAWHEGAFPMARGAMGLIRDKKLGPVHSVFVEYHLARSASVAGTHVVSMLAGAAENLVGTITNLKMRAVCAEVVLNPVTRAHDDAQVLLRFEGHTRGVMTLSRTGARAGFSVRVYGELASLAWSSEAAGELEFAPVGKARQVLTAAHAESGVLAAEAARNPASPEGATEALANLYRGTYEAIRAKREGRARKAMGRDLPTTSDLSRACRFTQGVMESARGGGGWAEL